MHLPIRTIGAVAVLAFVCGCGKHDLSLKFVAGETYTLTQEGDRTIRLENKEGAAEDSHSAAYTLHVVDVADGAEAKILVTIEDMATTLVTPESWGASGYLPSQIAALTKGQSFTLRMSRDGTVIDVEGAEAIVDHVIGALASEGEDPEKAKPIVEQQLSRAALIELFNNLFAYVPSENVAVGGTWTDTQLHTSGMPFRTQVTYTLESVENGIAHITYRGVVEPHNTRATIALGIPFDFSGTEQGSLRVDVATGRAISSEGEYTIESVAQGVKSQVNGHEKLTTST